MKRLAVIADLSIPLAFGGPQPNAFGTAHATASALGDTREGSSVNFDSVTLIPHCNGTHTECVGHITDERISVRDRLTDVLLRALLVSVNPTPVQGDEVVGVDELKRAAGAAGGGFKALIVRTLPNSAKKLTRVYDGENIPPYFGEDAMEWIVASGFRHLLVDLPSIDRLHDGGKLKNHRIFWNVEEGSRVITPAARVDSTVTELIYVPDEVEDGEYLLNLQIAPFALDAAPSRPLLVREME